MLEDVLFLLAFPPSHIASASTVDEPDAPVSSLPLLVAGLASMLIAVGVLFTV